VNACLPLPCILRSPNTNTLCVVYEDADTAVECYKIDDTSCDFSCPQNMDPLPSLSGGTCQTTPCNQRTPIVGVCTMPGDTSSCYSLTELNRCYSPCPAQTTVNTSIANNPRCVPIPCDSRSPDTRGVCLITLDDQCYTFNGRCVTECPTISSSESQEEKVEKILLFFFNFFVSVLLFFFFLDLFSC
jgi:hypothetical protein